MKPRKGIGERIMQLRRERTWTLKTAGENWGMSVQALSLMECGKQMPKADDIRRIADCCCVSADWILGRTKERESK